MNHIPEFLKRQFELINGLRSLDFTLKDVKEVSYRVISHWEEEGLIIAKSEKNAWRRYDFIEFVWIKLVIVFRKFGLSFPVIKEIRRQLMDPFKEAQLAEILQSPEAKKSIKNDLKKEDANFLLDEVNSIPSGEIIEADRPERKEYYCMLMTLVLSVILEREPITINVYEDGSCIPISNNKLHLYPEEIRDCFSKPCVSVPLHGVISEYVLKLDYKKAVNPLLIISEEEKAVLEHLRNDNLTELKIRFNDENEISILEITEKKKVSPESRFMDHIMQGGYQTVQFSTQNGSIVEFKNTRKIKIK